MNGTGDESMLTSDGSMLNNGSFNTTMNTSAEVAEEDNLDSSLTKKKKKKKKKKLDQVSYFNFSVFKWNLML